MTASPPEYNFDVDCVIEEGRVSQSELDDVKGWLLENSHIPPLSDQQIVLFLIACCNDVEFATKTVQNYFKHKVNAPELFCNCDPLSDNFKKYFEVINIAVCPKFTKDKNLVMLAGLRDTSYRSFNVEELVKLFFMCLEVGLNLNAPSGTVAVLDMKGFGFMHLTKLKLGTIQKVLSFLQESLHCKLKEIHIVNSNYLLDKVLFICRPFMKKELIDMIHPHLASIPFSEFHKYVEPDCLPIEYEGNLPSIEDLREKTFADAIKMKDFFDISNKQLNAYKPPK